MRSKLPMIDWWSLEYRCNLACVSLFYRYYNGFYSDKIRGLIHVNHLFLCNTSHSWLKHSYVVHWPVDRRVHDWQNSFSSRTIIWENSMKTLENNYVSAHLNNYAPKQIISWRSLHLHWKGWAISLRTSLQGFFSYQLPNF